MGEQITYTAIHAKVAAAVSANGSELAEGIDIDAVTREIVDTYGLVDIDGRDQYGEPVMELDEFWGIVRKHDSTQH